LSQDSSPPPPRNAKSKERKGLKPPPACPSVHLGVHPYVHLSHCASTCTPMCPSGHLCVPAHPSVCPSMHAQASIYHLCVCLHVCLHICVPAYACLCVHLCVSPCIHLCAHLCIHLSVHLHIHLYIHLCVHLCLSLHICLHFYASAWASVCLCIHVSTCASRAAPTHVSIYISARALLPIALGCGTARQCHLPPLHTKGAFSWAWVSPWWELQKDIHARMAGLAHGKDIEVQPKGKLPVSSGLSQKQKDVGHPLQCCPTLGRLRSGCMALPGHPSMHRGATVWDNTCTHTTTNHPCEQPYNNKVGISRREMGS